MGFFNIFKHKDINRGVEEYRAAPGALLLDVRTPQEYREGHIPGSKNVPLQTMNSAASIVRNKETPLYVYCYSGSRSSQAVHMLQRTGYVNVTNIGGFSAYSGKVER